MSVRKKYGPGSDNGGGGGGVPSLFASTIQDTQKLGTRKFTSAKKYVRKDINIGEDIVGKDADLEGFGDVIEKVKKEDIKVPAGAIRKHKMVNQLSGRSNMKGSTADKSGKKKGLDIFALIDDAIDKEPTEEAKEKARERAAAKKAAAEAPIPAKVTPKVVKKKAKSFRDPPSYRPAYLSKAKAADTALLDTTKDDSKIDNTQTDKQQETAPSGVPAMFASSIGSSNKEPAWKARLKERQSAMEIVREEAAAMEKEKEEAAAMEKEKEQAAALEKEKEEAAAMEKEKEKAAAMEKEKENAAALETKQAETTIETAPNKKEVEKKMESSKAPTPVDETKNEEVTEEEPTSTADSEAVRSPEKEESNSEPKKQADDDEFSVSVSSVESNEDNKEDQAMDAGKDEKNQDNFTEVPTDIEVTSDKVASMLKKEGTKETREDSAMPKENEEEMAAATPKQVEEPKKVQVPNESHVQNAVEPIDKTKASGATATSNKLSVEEPSSRNETPQQDSLAHGTLSTSKTTDYYAIAGARAQDLSSDSDDNSSNSSKEGGGKNFSKFKVGSSFAYDRKTSVLEEQDPKVSEPKSPPSTAPKEFETAEESTVTDTLTITLRETSTSGSNRAQQLLEEIKATTQKLKNSEIDARLEMAELRKQVEKDKEELQDEFEDNIARQRRVNDKQDREHQKVLEDEKKIVEHLRAENKRLRGATEKLPKQIADMKRSNADLEAANEEVDGHYESLSKFTKKLEKDHAKLMKSSSQCRDEYLPRYRQELRERQMYIDVETRIKSLYRSCAVKIAKHVGDSKKVPPSLSESIQEIIVETASEVDPKFDPKFLLDSSSDSSSSSGSDSSSDSDSD